MGIVLHSAVIRQTMMKNEASLRLLREKGVLKYKFIEMPPKYDESKFIGYDVEMMDDCSGFQFHMITNHFSEITFTVAWIKSEPGYEDEYEGAVQFWTT